MPLTVSQLASRAGISPDTVRYYGRLGLLPEAGRTDAGHRFYHESALERLRFIKGAQWFELRLEEIRDLLEAFDTGGCPCAHTREVILRRIAAIDEQRTRLDEMRAALCRLVGEAAPGPRTNGHAPPRRDEMTDTLTVTPPASADAEASGCRCCQPEATPTLDDEARELQARREAVERRLARLLQGQR